MLTKSTRIHGGPGPVAVRKNETPTPDHARVVVSTGAVSIHPDTWHRPESQPTPGCAPHDTGPGRCPSTPTSSSTATASCCSTPPGPGVGHRPGLLPRRRHRNPLRPPRALRHRPRQYAHRPAGGHRYDLADVRTAVLSHLHQDHIDGLPELRDAAADVVSRQEWQVLQQPLGASRAAVLPHPAPWAALAPHRACTNRRSRPGPVHGRPSPVRRREPGVAAHARPHIWLAVDAGPSPGTTVAAAGW